MKYLLRMTFAMMIGLAPALAHGQSCGGSVTVTVGDTLYEIAERCETTVSAVLRANPEIDDRNVIRVGWELTIPDGDDPLADRPDPQPDPTPTDPQPAPGGDYTVRPGDTLAEIAEGQGVALSALIAANPQIDNPNLIEVGATLEIPGTDAPVQEPRGRDWAGNVSIDPSSGAPGSRVRLRASGFPPNTAVRIGAGPVGSEYEILRRDIRTNANGAFVATTALPEYADGRWVFVVESADRRIRGRSDPFAVRSAGAPDDGRDDNLREVHRVEGTLADGVECPIVRTDRGEVYSLAGETGQFDAGERVYVEGTEAEASFCMQGTTLAVSTIRAAR